MRRVSNGTALLGGSPFRLIRLSAAGGRLLNRWLAGTTYELSESEAVLRNRLLRAGMVHPVIEPLSEAPAVAFVVPVHDDAHGLGALLTQLRSEFALSQIVVVDDASQDEVAVAAVAGEHGAQLERLGENGGPAAARNIGWRLVGDAPVVVFVDADVVPLPGSIRHVVAHLNDSHVAAAAPRVRARPGHTLLDTYERVASPLDMGAAPAAVKPGVPVSYVPSAALAVRMSALEEMGGFDESMRFGEDVDLIWRLADAGHAVRYEPAAVVEHRNRPTLGALLRQRYGYGFSAAALGVKHGETVTPLRLPAQLLAACLAAAFGGKLGVLAAAASAAVSTTSLSSKLEGKVDQPLREAAVLTAQAHRGAVGALANAATRSYLPLLLPMLLRRRTRPAVLAAAVVPPMIAWWKQRPKHDPISHIALSTADDAAYCVGVWRGAHGARSVAALRPVISFPEAD